ncbi:FixH family protein [Paracoccus sp. M683]|uniref:FixH family protein n=1 Tax=Paracoccus sp. M683 TaxID=2594268 RepID=UPI0011802C83|nr:FixH family protein [Paracoccus sp. M683]TRW99558.1 FixH family protein [Paracoccus sp. M683]
MSRELTGRHVALIFVGCFSIIIGVNLVLATQAIRTFPGLEVKNSYVASQVFDRDRRAQEALGWTAAARIEGEALYLDLTGPGGQPAKARIIEAKLGRATHVADDRMLDFQHSSGATFIAATPGLDYGTWHLWLEAEAADGTRFRQRLDLWADK